MLRIPRSVTIHLLLAALASGEAAAQDAPNLGVETTSVTLLLVDVSVLDKEGRPIRGLTIEDFSVQLDRKRWPIYSVDDFCRPDDPGLAAGASPLPAAAPSATVPSPTVLSPTTSSPTTSSPSAPAQPPAAERPVTPAPSAHRISPGPGEEAPRFILYLDFSQLQHGGRRRAIDEARRWIRETRRSSDTVMLAAYATASGYRELTPFTTDESLLLAALDRAYLDPALNDPFPTLRAVRMLECPPECARNAWSEYEHAMRSRQALQNFTEGLSLLEGTKVVLYFHQNGLISPGRLFRGAYANDLSVQTESLGAAASEAHAVIYPAFVGNSTDVDAEEATMEFGRTLAGYTGGQFNRGMSKLAELTSEARIRASCIYRIGLLPPEEARRRPYPVTVRAAGRLVADELRVRVLSGRDLWLKEARTVLFSPHSASGIPVAAAILPVRADAKGWVLDVHVSFEISSVALLPSAGRRTGAWEVGALLMRDDGEEAWEMLGTSTVRLPEGREAPGGEGSAMGAVMLHQRRFTSMAPGTYSLAAFVRDASLNVFGGASAEIALPVPAEGGIAGPVVVARERPRILLDLPLDSGDPDTPSVASTISRGTLPLDPDQIAGASPIMISTWLCGEGEAPGFDRRFLSLDGKPLARFEPVARSSAGRCARLDDEILIRIPGLYGYHLNATESPDLRFTVLRVDTQ